MSTPSERGHLRASSAHVATSSRERIPKASFAQGSRPSRHVQSVLSAHTLVLSLLGAATHKGTSSTDSHSSERRTLGHL